MPPTLLPVVGLRAQWSNQERAGAASDALPPGSAAGAIAMYEEGGKDIFPPYPASWVKKCFQFFKPAYHSNGLERVLNSVLRSK